MFQDRERTIKAIQEIKDPAEEARKRQQDNRRKYE